MKEGVSACIRLYNLDIANHTFSGCIKAEFRLLVFVVETIHFGCFHIPVKGPMSRDLIELVEYVKLHEKYNNWLVDDPSLSYHH